MSEGSVFVRGDGRACAKYTDAKGKTRYLYGKSKPEVRRKLRQALKDRDEGITPGEGKVTVAVFLDLWLEDITHSRFQPFQTPPYHLGFFDPPAYLHHSDKWEQLDYVPMQLKVL